ncbi:MAG: rod shape-determining protein MreC [Bacteroidales bacterium]|nr:rod shape-determining protein MreC [Bacteroidales bacterium]MBN2749663.1 rod shape-determining protein MreC [Bacteroidales bacterium]
MNSLIRFLTRYQYVLLFLLLEGISLWLLAENGYYQRAFFGSFARNISGFVYSQTDKLDQYLELRQSNLNLAAENIALRNDIARLSYALNEYEHSPRIDSLNGVKYQFVKAKLVNNSVNKQHNFITLNVGKKHGIEPEMGVISHNGIVGIVASVSENYCTVISLLNIDLKISAKLQKTGYFGSLYWNGIDYRQVVLSDIPQHVQLTEGDTVVTSGYSAIFPPNIPLGVVGEISNSGGNFFTVKVNLISDFKRLDYVTVIKNLQDEERFNLEKADKNG